MLRSVLLPPPPRSTLFPYTTLFRSLLADGDDVSARLLDFGLAQMAEAETLTAQGDVPGTLAYISPERLAGEEDRKSTRLNSSHITISYAVFCLKKKRNQVECFAKTS